MASWEREELDLTRARVARLREDVKRLSGVTPDPSVWTDHDVALKEAVDVARIELEGAEMLLGLHDDGMEREGRSDPNAVERRAALAARVEAERRQSPSAVGEEPS